MCACFYHCHLLIWYAAFRWPYKVISCFRFHFAKRTSKTIRFDFVETINKYSKALSKRKINLMINNWIVKSLQITHYLHMYVRCKYVNNISSKPLCMFVCIWNANELKCSVAWAAIIAFWLKISYFSSFRWRSSDNNGNVRCYTSNICTLYTIRHWIENGLSNLFTIQTFTYLQYRWIRIGCLITIFLEPNNKCKLCNKYNVCIKHEWFTSQLKKTMNDEKSITSPPPPLSIFVFN